MAQHDMDSRELQDRYEEEERPFMRVSEIAKRVGVGSREVFDFLRSRGVMVKTPSSKVDLNLSRFIIRFFEKNGRLPSVPPTSHLEDVMVQVMGSALMGGSNPHSVLSSLRTYVAETHRG
jgi:hypothetical protein